MTIDPQNKGWPSYPHGTFEEHFFFGNCSAARSCRGGNTFAAETVIAVGFIAACLASG